ncbi:efflux RND transporter periplasmic adaptor subunit [Synechococcus sp. CS-1328]|uniref:efflux RND transporter periplasmic adaptor subunit n=1 Tax=Synechococcus sp. CS-1328 TaxID=2847976 RepID=UPI00223BFD5F|nr:efflux RND transporter periplasmic adaptor subunit [Synechococcus sp. CS-1328]MCT0223587.1 efflux RND transporter periplasmic adaptor subunit [Synechococcus sp. CS-1328]
MKSLVALRFGAGLVALTLPLQACSPPKPPPPQAPLVQIEQPTPRTFNDQATYQSTLEAIRDLKLAAEIDGRIVAMPMREGQSVSQGQPLFRLDQVQQRAEVDAAASEARRDLVNAQRFIFLNEQGAVSTLQRDYYVTQALTSRDKLIGQQATLAYKDVVAPIAGQVGSIAFKLGDFVRAGTVVTTVIDNSVLWVRLDVPASQAWRVRRGLPVILQLPDQQGQLARGALTFVAPSVDKTSQTLLTKATFDNREGLLRNGQRVSATLVFAQEPLLSIPESAVLLQAGKTFVFLALPAAEASRRLGRPLATQPPSGALVAVQVPVRVGALQQGRFALLDGLQSSDRFILGNLAQLRSGSVVRTTPAGSARP